MKKQSYFIIFIIACALLIGIWREGPADTAPAHSTVKQFSKNSLIAGTMISGSRKLSPFTLTNMLDEPFTHDSLKHNWSFLSFGYTSCPDVCSATIGSMHHIAKRLPATAKLQFVFVTIDPNKDTPAHLHQYFQDPQYNGTPFMGVTGKREHIHQLAAMLGAHVGEENITLQHIEHGGAIFLINPEGKLNAIFTDSSKSVAIANDFKTIMHQYAQAS